MIMNCQVGVLHIYSYLCA